MDSQKTKIINDDSSQFGPGEVVAVLLPLPLAGAYDYKMPEGLSLRPGIFVSVPLGNRHVSGVVWGAGAGDVEPAKVKSIATKLEVPPLNTEIRQFVDWVAAYTLNAPGAVLKMVMSVPQALSTPEPVTAFAFGEIPDGLKITTARQRVLDMAKNGPPRTRPDLAREAAVGASVVTGLAKAGALKEVFLKNQPSLPEPDWARPGYDLSPKQEEAADVLSAAVGNGFSVTLLDGVPGSGKTEVYFQAVAKALEEGGQVLVLLPEIALSAQWLDRFQARFGVVPVEWHSDLTMVQRRNNWRAVAEHRVRVMVGARSALFLPFADLKLIVVDEEHESAFKQEEGAIYHARDMAVVRAKKADIPIVLASATPSLETVINAREGRYRELTLPDRHGGALLPDIELIDMREDKLKDGVFVSSALREALKKTFDAGEQAMLFLNRRGYAPLTLCRTCGHRLQCPRCTAWLVEHKRLGKLQCHHCGYNVRPPEKCPSCEDEGNFAACGPGVERLEEEIKEMFPDIRTVIAASDVIVGPKAAANLVRRIEGHEVDLIIGTQIVAKGYHFPLLTLVGVVDADLGLGGGDLRAAERTYQLLYQVAGRAGRGEKPGRVLLQTFMPEHPVMKAMVAGNREDFIKVETEARKILNMPPFGRLAALIISGFDAGAVDDACRALARNAPYNDRITVLGPAPAPLSLLRGKHRRRFLIKAGKSDQLQSILKTWVGTTHPIKGVKIRIDIDPYSFL